MRLYLTCLLSLLLAAPAIAQKGQPHPEYRPSAPTGVGTAPDKMPCEAGNTLAIVSCDGEDGDEGDGLASNGAFMTWTATGSTTGLYYSRIYNGPDTFQIVQGGTSNSVYAEGADGTHTSNLIIGSGTNGCLAPGIWTVQVWSVLDDDGNLMR